MKGIRRIIILIFTSFMVMGLTGCSETILVEEEVKKKLEYDKKISDMLQKSSDAFPKESKSVFDEYMKEIRSELESVFKNSKESENLKLKDSIKKELKELETAYIDLVENFDNIEFYINFFNLKFVTDEQRLAIKPVYEISKEYIEKRAMKCFDILDINNASQVAATSVLIEKEMSQYKLINEFYGTTINNDYQNTYDLKLPEYKEIIDKNYTLDNSKIGYFDVKVQSERETMWEMTKSEIDSKLKSSGKIVFPSNVMSEDIIIKKSGSIYIIKSYVDIEKGGSKERKEFTVKYDVTMNYYMLISVVV